MSFANMGELLNRKYAILGEHGDAALSSAVAQNRQAGVQESLAPSMSSRNFAEGGAALGNANAAQTSASSRARLEDVTGSLLPGQAAAENAFKRAQTGAINNASNAALSDDQLQLIQEGLRQRALTAGQPSSSAPSAAPGQASGWDTFWSARNHGVGINGLAIPSASAATAVPSLDSSTSTALPTVEYGDGHAKGIAKVPGKGDGTVDKVPAMLAPGEAVLNAGAAEHFGRHNIAALNAVGQAKMQAGKGAPGKGMPQPQGAQHFADGTANVQPSMDSRGSFSNGAIPTSPGGAGSREGGVADIQDMYRRFPTDSAAAKPQHFKGGTHMVGHGKSAQTPKIDPGVIQALMSMGGGGGAPPMGGAPMMPPAPGMVPPGR